MLSYDFSLWRQASRNSGARQMDPWLTYFFLGSAVFRRMANKVSVRGKNERKEMGQGVR